MSRSEPPTLPLPRRHRITVPLNTGTTLAAEIAPLIRGGWDVRARASCVAYL